MNDTIAKIINEIGEKEKFIDCLNKEIRELKKRKEDSSQKENEKKKMEDEIQKLWHLIVEKIPPFIKEENQKDMIYSCGALAKRFKEGDLTTSQIRNVYGEVKKIQMKNSMLKENEKIDVLPIRMILPKLAYSAARAKKKGTEEFKDILTKGIETVLENEDFNELKKRFEMFANFFEALLAYHKAEGGN